MGLCDILPRLTEIVNSSLSTGRFLDSLKHAIIRSLLKKPSLDLGVLDNYRPVSNLSFVGEVIEKIVVNQLDHHLSSHGLHSKFQSAYRKFHSTETALRCVQLHAARGGRRAAAALELFPLYVLSHLC